VFRLKVDAEHLKVEEDKLKIIWHAAGIEKWLLGIKVIKEFAKERKGRLLYLLICSLARPFVASSHSQTKSTRVSAIPPAFQNL
jgi:hypothetical protein